MIHANGFFDWCYEWEMGVGIRKCGVMCVANYDEVAAKGRITADEGQRPLPHDRIVLMGQPIPVAEEYVYLGLLFRRHLSLSVMVAARLGKTERGLRCVWPFISSRTAPLPIRVVVFRAVVYHLPCMVVSHAEWMRGSLTRPRL